jgi:hypothetical protein
MYSLGLKAVLRLERDLLVLLHFEVVRVAGHVGDLYSHEPPAAGKATAHLNHI